MAKVEWGKLINPALSFFDKEFRAWAEKAAKTIPRDSFLREEPAERAFDILRGFLEKNIQLNNTAAQAIKEKVIDIGDYFATSLFRKEKADKKAVAAAQDWMKRFLAYAEKHLSEAKSLEDLNVEFDRLQREFEIRRRIVEIMEVAAKAAEPSEPTEPETQSIDWKAKFEDLKEKVKRYGRSVDKAAGKTALKVRNFRFWLAERG